jgi:hypothetical protein
MLAGDRRHGAAWCEHEAVSLIQAAGQSDEPSRTQAQW